ncbi:hypothetical protein CAP35_09915 [Chitinophagaceae bacterium IBVUCB1]|nr:hypothetical protein CAP35_09915 [Chitinophagaceae bacterium IBVUCB1]
MGYQEKRKTTEEFMKTRIFPVVVTAAITSLATLYAASKLYEPKPYFDVSEKENTPVKFAAYESGTAKTMAGADFQMAAENSVKAVVHIKTETKARTVQADDVFGRMFGQQYYIPPQQGAGSGVVISADGYIVTNNHVVANADQVTVTFNDRYTTKAKVVSKDGATDLAVLKVEEKNLPFMEFGNSDNVKLGQWVLAVGYPLTLDATVTAGIVSAKSRSIGINRSQADRPIESFIQTDAAVNPGNSGGALVNTDGLLIGINAAIASPTGSYAGYSYAIPSNIVRKVVNDMVQFGAVQRGYLGVNYIDSKNATPEEISSYGLDKTEGVYIMNVMEGSGAEKGGLQKGDFITAINNNIVRTSPELQEQIARHRPGDVVKVTYVRNGTSKIANVELKKEVGQPKLLGAEMRSITNEEKKKYGIAGGVVITNTGRSVLAQARIKNGYVITAVDDNAVNTVDDLKKAIGNNSSVQIAGFYPGIRGMYYYNLSGLTDPNQE